MWYFCRVKYHASRSVYFHQREGDILFFFLKETILVRGDGVPVDSLDPSSKLSVIESVTLVRKSKEKQIEREKR